MHIQFSALYRQYIYKYADIFLCIKVQCVVLHFIMYYICPRSFVQFPSYTFYMKMDKTSWIHSNIFHANNLKTLHRKIQNGAL